MLDGGPLGGVEVGHQGLGVDRTARAPSAGLGLWSGRGQGQVVEQRAHLGPSLGRGSDCPRTARRATAAQETGTVLTRDQPTTVPPAITAIRYVSGPAVEGASTVIRHRRLEFAVVVADPRAS